MADISDSEGLEAWLNGKSPELACVLATRAALRAAPVLGRTLHEEEEDRRRSVVREGECLMRIIASAAGAARTPARRN